MAGVCNSEKRSLFFSRLPVSGIDYRPAFSPFARRQQAAAISAIVSPQVETPRGIVDLLVDSCKRAGRRTDSHLLAFSLDLQPVPGWALLRRSLRLLAQGAACDGAHGRVDLNIGSRTFGTIGGGVRGTTTRVIQLGAKFGF